MPSVFPFLLILETFPAYIQFQYSRGAICKAMAVCSYYPYIQIFKHLVCVPFFVLFSFVIGSPISQPLKLT
ncbi:putative signal peptide protein [Puccinia sorghi]|uniref:Putative signal peptide protein n=1 Tax=Puccinia sorghi TaxID=27349 RepID=A0A0L6UEL3_9BASI|nr:putative signal peptide protein [Puccinia sorghi]